MAVIAVPGPISGKAYKLQISGDSPTVDEQKRIDAFVSQREQEFQVKYASQFGAPVETGESTGVLNYLGEIPKGIARGAVNLGESAFLGAAAALPESFETPVRAGIRRAAYTIAPQSDIGLEDSLSAKLSEGIGSMAVPYALSAVPYVGMPLAMGLSTLAGAGEASENARAAGATPGQRSTAAFLGLGPGALDILPVRRLEKALEIGLGAGAATGVKAVLKRALAQGGVEATQETAQQVAQNLIAKGVYDPEKDVFANTGEAAGLGGSTGALVSLILELAPGRRRGGVDIADPVADPVDETQLELPLFDRPQTREGQEQGDFFETPQQTQTAQPTKEEEYAAWKAESEAAKADADKAKADADAAAADAAAAKGTPAAATAAKKAKQTAIVANQKAKKAKATAAKAPKGAPAAQGISTVAATVPDETQGTLFPEDVPAEAVATQVEQAEQGTQVEPKAPRFTGPLSHEEFKVLSDADKLVYMDEVGMPPPPDLSAIVGRVNSAVTPTTIVEPAATPNITEVGDAGMTLLHGGRSGLDLDSIEIVREPGATKQGKKNRVYGGLYTAPESDAAYAESYAAQIEDGEVYNVKIKPGTKILNKDGDITRLSPAQIDAYKADGVGIVFGKDPRGKTEYAVVDKNAIESLSPRIVAKPAARKTLSLKDKKAADTKALADYFTPGNIVESYTGTDRVLSFSPGGDGSINVEVEAVELKDGVYQTKPGTAGRVRTHSTKPDTKKLMKGPVARKEQNGQSDDDAATGAGIEDVASGTQNIEPDAATAGPTQGSEDVNDAGLGESGDVTDGTGAPEGAQPTALSDEAQQAARQAKQAIAVHAAVIDARAVENAKKAEAIAPGAGAIYQELFDTEQPTADQEFEIPNILTEADVRKITDLFPLSSKKEVSSTNKAGENAAKRYFERYRNPMAALRRIAEDIYTDSIYESQKGTPLAEATAYDQFHDGTGGTKAKSAMAWIEANLSPEAASTVDALIGKRVETQEQRFIRRVTTGIKADEMRGEIVEQLNTERARAINADTRTEANLTLELAAKLASKNVPGGGVSLGGTKYVSPLTAEQVAAAKAAAKEKAGTAEVFLRNNPGVQAAAARFEQAVQEEAAVDAVVNKISKARRANNARIAEEIRRLQGRLRSATMALEQMLPTYVQSFLANNNLRAALDGIARTSKDPRLSKLAMRMRTLVKNTQVQMVDTLVSADGRVMAAAYDPATDTILFNRSAPDAMTNVTALHEVAHAITHKALNNPSLPITQQLKKLFDEASAALGPDTVGTDNIHEFVAEAFTNQTFRDALESTYPKGGNVSAWSRFKNAVSNFLRRVFGASPKPVGASMDGLDTLLDQLLNTSSDATGLRPDPDQGVFYRASASPKAAASMAVNLGRAQNQRFAQPTIVNREKWAERAQSVFDTFRDIIPSGALGLLKVQAVADIAKRMGITGGFELNSAIEKMMGASYAGDQQANAILQAATNFVQRFPDRKVLFDKIVWESTTDGVDPRHPDDYYAKFYLQYAPDGDFTNATYVGFSTGAARTAKIAELKKQYGDANVKQSRNPNMKKDAIHKDLRKQWATLGKEGQDLYTNMAKFYKARFIELRDGFGAQIDAAINATGTPEGKAAADQLKKGIYERFFDFRALEPYFPLVRKGDYWLEYIVKDPDTGADEAILETFETSYARTQAMADLTNVPGIAKDANGALRDVKIYRRTDLNQRNIGPADSIFMRDIIQALAARGVDPSIINDVSKMFIDALPETSFAKSLQKRKNVQGAITDATEAFRLKAFSLSNQATRYKFATEIRGITDSIALQARGALSNDPTRLAVVQELVSRGKLAVNPPTGIEHDLAKVGTQFAFLQTLGFNVSSSIVEMASIPVVAQPYLSGIYGFKKTSNAIYDAYKLFLNSGFDREMPLMTKYDGKDTVMMRASPSMDNYVVLKDVGGVPTYALRDDLKVSAALKAQLTDMLPFIKLLADTGNLNRSAIYDTIGVESGGAPTNGLEKMAKAVGYLQHMSGRSNRQVTAMAAYTLELQRIRTNPTAAERAMTNEEKQAAAGNKALYMTTDINGSHSMATGPRYSQTALGRLVLMYKNYGIHMATLQAKLANQVVRGLWSGATPEDKELRKVAFRQLMGMQLSSALFAGISGVPIYGLIKSIWGLWNSLFGDKIDDPDTITRQFIGDTAFRGPITDILDINISSRVGLNDLLIRDNPYLTDASAADYFMGYFGGPVWSTGTQFARGLSEMGSAISGGMGNFERGVETITPAGLVGPIKAMRFMIESGANTRRGDPIYDNMGAGELAGQLIGFKPAGLAKTQEVTRELSRINTLVTLEKDTLMRRLNMARRFGDYNERSAIELEIKAFNEKRGPQFPKLRITKDTKDKSWAAYKRKTADMYNGVSFSAATDDALKAIGDDMLGSE